MTKLTQDTPDLMFPLKTPQQVNTDQLSLLYNMALGKRECDNKG